MGARRYYGYNVKGVNRMAASTKTVSAEEVLRYAEQKARELGLTDLLRLESWAHPLHGDHALPDKIDQLRNRHMRLQITTQKAR